MRIAVTYDNGMIYQHYSRSPWIKIYDVAPGVITNTQLVQARGFLRKYNVNDILKDYGVNLLITGRIGIAARLVVSAAGIEIRDRHTGSADHAVANLIGMHIDPPPRPAPIPKTPKRTLTAPRAPQPKPSPRQTVMRTPAPKPAPAPRTMTAPKRAPMAQQPPQQRPAGGTAPKQPSRQPKGNTPPGQPQTNSRSQTGRQPAGRPQSGTPGNSRGGGFRK